MQAAVYDKDTAGGGRLGSGDGVGAMWTLAGLEG